MVLLGLAAVSAEEHLVDEAHPTQQVWQSILLLLFHMHASAILGMPTEFGTRSLHV
jgi:hypothetical protein